MHVIVRLFASHREAAGTDTIHLTMTDGETAADAYARARAAHVALPPSIDGLAFAINREIAGAATRLNDGDEVAVLPPVAGG